MNFASCFYLYLYFLLIFGNKVLSPRAPVTVSLLYWLGNKVFCTSGKQFSVCDATEHDTRGALILIFDLHNDKNDYE